MSTYVAVERGIAHEAQRRLSAGKLKGKTIKVRVMDVSDNMPPRESAAAVTRRDR